MSFSNLTVRDFLGSLAGAEPTPGGGTAAAIAGAMGASLLMMVAGLNRTRGNTDEERAALADVRTRYTRRFGRPTNLGTAAVWLVLTTPAEVWLNGERLGEPAVVALPLLAGRVDAPGVARVQDQVVQLLLGHALLASVAFDQLAGVVSR